MINWTRQHSQIGIVFSMCILLFHIIIFPTYILPTPILFMGIGIILFFFTAVYYYSFLWQNISGFSTRLFTHSLLYRVLGFIGMYLLTMFYDPNSLPFEIGAADSWNYHHSGIIVADAIYDGKNIFTSLSHFWKSESDYGFSIIIGFLYSIFGKYPIVIKIFNAIIGSVTVVRIYQITKIIYSEKQAKIAGIITMLMPPLLWFGGMFLKETFLMFLLINASYFTMRVTASSTFKVFYLIIVLLHFGFIFYFRVVLAPILLGAVLLQIVFLNFKRRKDRLISFLIVITIIIGSFYVMKITHMDRYVQKTLEDSSSQFSNEIESASKTRGVTYAVALVAPLLIAGAIITPLPSVLNFEDSQLGIYTHFQNEIIRNGMYFFVFLGLLRAIRLRQKKTILIGFMAIAYIMILAASGISHQDRFQILSLPFLIMFMSDGIVSKYPKQRKHWVLYLLLLFIVILIWNIFKLSIRGLI